ncbi:MFS transporter [Siccirubricoccus phaeus]|uniref:MFS transporter n=1 Tax=Siccirubricoccus phaeus TaxID=2595053 RepID=UPI0011F115F1|nr:MFS transporter [Siccirubricoccus phaeus]
MLKRLQWATIGLLFAGGLINYMDRAVFAVLAPLIGRDLELDPAQLGLAFSVFSFGYTIFCFFGGWAADRFGSKRTLAVSMALWSVFCGLIGTAGNFLSLLVLRTLFGIGESPYISAANKVLMRWFSRERYAGAFGLASSGQPLGGVVAGPLVGVIAAAFGWRAAFFAVAAIGLAWVLCWLLLAANSPEEHPWLGADEREKVQRERQAEAAATPPVPGGLRDALRQPSLIATSLCFFSYSYLLYFFLSWFPSYLTMSLGMSVGTMSVVSAIPWMLGALGLISGGFICDYVTRLSGDPLRGRKMVLVVGLLVAAGCVALAGLVSSVPAAVTLMGLGVGFMYLTGPTYYAIGLDGVPEQSLGSVGGFMVFVANVGGMLAPIITGYLVKGTGTFISAFILAAVLVVLGALTVALFARRSAADEAAPASARPLGAGRA